MKKFTFLILLFFFIVSCSSLKDAGKVLRNEKIKTTDEFLVKKREPLVYPPNYDKLPEPGSKENQNQASSEKEKIKNILKVTTEDNNVNNKSKSIEDKILREIRK
tara:strand:+ start:303 stop:617 length:315 start_codon:yes stop_codon:yes gene_type:complete